MDFASVMMRAFYQVAEETTGRAEVLEYIHETLRDEDHTIPSSRRIFDANSFAGLSARHGNEFERRFYTELCSSSMFTQFVCDRVVFGVRALFDHYVARKVVRVGVRSVRARSARISITLLKYYEYYRITHSYHYTLKYHSLVSLHTQVSLTRITD